MLTNRECRKINRNLRLDYPISDSSERHSCVLYDTPVVTKRTDLKSGVSLYTLQTGGWKTQLTKKVMGEVVSRCMTHSVYISMSDGDLWFHDPKGYMFWVGDSLTVNKYGYVNDYDYA
jgi:hypothetical protein